MRAVGRATAVAHGCLAPQSQLVHEPTHALAVGSRDRFGFAAQLSRHPPLARGWPRRCDLLAVEAQRRLSTRRWTGTAPPVGGVDGAPPQCPDAADHGHAITPAHL